VIENECPKKNCGHGNGAGDSEQQQQQQQRLQCIERQLTSRVVVRDLSLLCIVGVRSVVTSVHHY